MKLTPDEIEALLDQYYDEMAYDEYEHWDEQEGEDDYCGETEMPFGWPWN